MAEETVIAGNAPAVMDDSIEKANVPVSAGESFRYSLTEAGQNAMNYLMSSYLTIYLTDIIGIAGAFVSGLLLFSRIFDAVNDPIIGSLADRTHTRFGRYKPWVFFGSIAMAVTVTLMFANSPTWSDVSKVVYATVVYLLVSIASTSMFIPQVALNGIITSNAKSRAKLASWRMVVGNVGNGIVPMVGMPLILFFSRSGGSADAHGYTMAIMLMCAVAGTFGIIGSISAKERLAPPKSQVKIPAKQQLRAMFKNPAILILMVCFVAHGFVAYGRGAVLLYYFTYYAGDVGLFSYMGIAGIIGSFVGPTLIFSFLHRITKHKGKTAAISLFCVSVMFILLSVIDPRNFMWWVCSAFASACTSSFSAAIFSAIPDTADYGELLSGVRVDGFLASSVTFGLKVGGAIGPAIYIAMYTAAGYVPNQPQNATVLGLINGSVTFIPAIIVFCVGLLMFFGYKISDAKHAEILDTLQEKRAANER